MLSKVERLALLLGLVSAIVMGVGGASALAATPAVGWFIESVHGPTNLAPGGEAEYKIYVFNRGAVPSNGSVVTVTDHLPGGIATTATPTGEGWTCTAGAGNTIVTCTTTKVVSANAPAATISINASVPSGAVKGSTLTNLATVVGGGAPEPASTAEQAKVSTAQAPFGIQSIEAEEYGVDGKLYTQAGGHPYAASATVRFNTDLVNGVIQPPGNLKDVEVALPPGFIGDPFATPKCFTENCPPSSQVGMMYLGDHRFSSSGETQAKYPIYNTVAPSDMAAEFKFKVVIPTIFIFAKVRSNGDYGLTAYSNDLVNYYYVDGFTVNFWGTPANGTHTSERPASTPSNSDEVAFLSNPTDCSSEAREAPVATGRTDSWQQAGAFSETSYMAPPVTGCNALSFNPQIAFAPETSQAGQPTGYGFHLRVPQNESPEGNATSELRDASVTLPSGMGVSPSATGGLTACSEGQLGLHSLSAGECPLSSQVATTQIWTPLVTTQPTLRQVNEAFSGGTSGITKGTEAGELECTNGTWEGSPTHYTYTWLRDGVVIPGAEKTNYAPVVADDGKSVQCEVTASNAAGNTVAVSAGEVEFPLPSPMPPSTVGILPRIEGGANIGDLDTCTTGGWAGAPTSFSYQWLRGGVAILGAESSTYTPTAADEGQALQCQVTASNAGGGTFALSLAEVVGSPAAAPPTIAAPLKGRVYVAEPSCSPCSASDVAEGKLLHLYLEAEGLGVRVKLPGSVSVNPSTGQLTAHFEENPQLPFEELQLNFKGGPRALLANPQQCGSYTATSDLEPWSAPELADALPSSTFNVDFNGHGAACPSSLPFNPSFTAGTISSAAGGFSNFTLTFSRPNPANESEERSEQDFSGIQVHTPPGLLGKLAGVPLCGEPQASQGTCPADTQIGVTTVAAGAGSHPLQLKGDVYLTTGYKGAPFGLSLVVASEAGPFRLAGTTGTGLVVVRAAINVDPNTAALTITSDPLPRIVDGVILRLHTANVEINRPGFIFNATNCGQQQIAATLTGAQGATQNVSSPYTADGCANLPFNPAFTVSTQAKTSKADGASLVAKLVYPAGTEADVKMVKVELPKQLPSRLTTLQKACLASTFEANPAACPAASVVGSASAITPVLPVPLEGPVYFVSHGGEAFPSLIVVLQGYGVRIDLIGSTFISKAGITSSTFKTVPDAPVSSFQLTLPEGKYSALAANGNLCTSNLVMPTTIEGQNGKLIKQSTKIAVTGCPKAKAKSLTRAQKLARALKACKKKPKKKRAACRAQAHKRYGAKAAKSARARPKQKTIESNRRSK